MKDLKRRLQAVPEVFDAGIRIWLDQDDLRLGESWQHQLEVAIRQADTFLVYVGTRGIVNWVDLETRLALARAAADPDNFRLIPVLAKNIAAATLPAFARLFHGVEDIEGDEEAFRKLVRCILRTDTTPPSTFEQEPFFGLSAVDEARSYLFFGREGNTDAVMQLLQSEPIVVVTGDSGSGKSSLIQAGLLPRWRGGALAEAQGERPNSRIWHVVAMRPRGSPFRMLRDAIYNAAEVLRLPAADRDAYASWASGGDVERIRRALRCGLPEDKTSTLLFIDQLEEVFTQADPAERDAFLSAMTGLITKHDGSLKIIASVRHDYYNLIRASPDLYARLEANDRLARYLLPRMTDQQLRTVVTEPLRLAGIEEPRREELATSICADVGQRPGDLALLQFALSETWRHRLEYSGDLLRTYENVGRVEGALAQAAERVYERELRPYYASADVEAVFIRLVHLGDTAGATRRVARRSEFDTKRWEIVQALAEDRCNRLLLISGEGEQSRVEIAHEALVTQWARYEGWLHARANEKRLLDLLAERALGWEEEDDPETRSSHLASGIERERFQALAAQFPTWLSPVEQEFVDESEAAFLRQKKLEQDRRTRELRSARIRFFAVAAVAILLAAFGVTVFLQGAESERLRKRAVQNAALVQTVAAPAVAEEGLTDRALLTLLDAAPDLPVPAPASVEIAYHRVLQSVSGIEEVDIPRDMIVFQGAREVYLASPKTGDVYLLTDTAPPPLLINGSGPRAFALVARYNETSFVIVDSNGTVSLFDARKDTTNVLHRFPDFARFAEDMQPTVRLDGSFILRQKHEGTITRVQLYDVETALDGVLSVNDALDLVVITTADGTPYLTTRSFSEGWEVDLGDPPSRVTLEALPASSATSLQYTWCTHGMDVDRSTIESEVMRGYGDSDNAYSVTGCSRTDDGVVIHRESGSSSGPRRSDLYAFEQNVETKPGAIEIKDALDELLAQDGQGLPDLNFSWLQANKKGGDLAAAIGREVYTFGFPFGYTRRTTLAEAPAAGLFVGPDKLALVQPIRGKIAVLTVGQNQDDPRPTIRSSSAAKFIGAPAEGTEYGKLSGRLSVSSCSSRYAEIDARFVSTNGTSILIDGGDPSTEEPAPLLITLGGSKTKIAENVVCADISRDLRFIILRFNHLVGASNIVMASLPDIISNGGISEVKLSNVGEGFLRSSHFVGDGSQTVIYTNGSNSVWQATIDAAGSITTETQIYRGGASIYDAELDATRK